MTGRVGWVEAEVEEVMTTESSIGGERSSPGRNLWITTRATIGKQIVCPFRPSEDAPVAPFPRVFGRRSRKWSSARERREATGFAGRWGRWRQQVPAVAAPPPHSSGIRRQHPAGEGSRQPTVSTTGGTGRATRRRDGETADLRQTHPARLPQPPGLHAGVGPVLDPVRTHRPAGRRGVGSAAGRAPAPPLSCAPPAAAGGRGRSRRRPCRPGIRPGRRRPARWQ